MGSTRFIRGGLIVMPYGLPNQTVEATAPSRCRFVRHMFYYVVVAGGAALPGAVPHLGRSAVHVTT
jgi:hypothetical protein